MRDREKLLEKIIDFYIRIGMVIFLTAGIVFYFRGDDSSCKHSMMAFVICLTAFMVKIVMDKIIDKIS